ncbi:MAG: FtsX-like permease family protein [Chitinophagaceae bacterium]|nr:FtsX-like permease family protein [Chitinophagaceae bacterium]
MLKNYFKIAIAVLKRRKFFTFISLFGISFTLTILIVLSAFVDHVISPNYPDVNRDRSLYVNNMRLQSSKKQWTQSGSVSFYFLDHYVSKLKSPEKLAIASHFTSTNTYVNNKKLVINISYTNDEFWNVLQFDFKEGRPFIKQQVDNGEKVAVISEDTKKKYFGEGAAVVGKYIEADNMQYRVIGVVKSVPITQPFAYADMYLPYTVSKMDVRRKELTGNYSGILLAASASDRDAIKKEYAAMAAKIPTNDKEFDLLFTFADSYLANFTRDMFGGMAGNGIPMFILVISIFLFLFMLLPTLNLVNINISRIMERSSEIGVRKAFGASSGTLVYQFIIENLILTFIGGVLGLLFSFIIIQVINNSGMIANLHLTINLQVLLYSIMACVVFGFFSGVYPAWRMSRLHVVKALKA